ncbi:YrhK family protein [Saccharopolyspora sp. NFXS83]|uniref:YrhK family protein n=1 Tax=Saccharopolyspora sp. NFXS83 TaxID=2993560 RepID=UPI00224B1501|nr:YrhK family protein [Saccharopolyspora sp. NFXS83]MCX2729066.1 YrhK family protein [Saccharopolyspora sp. NFXS83]
MGEIGWKVRIGHDELVVRRRYELLGIGNDMLVALWFIAGSVLFFHDYTATAGTWMFLLGSIELAIRPALRLSRHLHLRRFGPAVPHESSQEF